MLADSHYLHLPSGIGEFIDTALAKGAAVGLLAGTCSIPEEQIMTAALFALGEERTHQLHTFTCNPQQSSRANSDVQQGSDESLTMEQSMAAARARVRPPPPPPPLPPLQAQHWRHPICLCCFKV